MYTIKRFFDCQVPVNRCNFECDYCTVGQWRKVNGEGPKEYTEFKYPIEHMIKALSKERLGGTCAFNLCGNGETFLHPQLLELVEALLKEGHFVSIVSNGTITKGIDYLCSLDEEMRSRIFIKFSFHYTELLKKNLLTTYFKNVNKAHKAGLSLTVELVASDGNVPYIEDIKKVCMENLGVLCHLTDPRANTTTDIRHLTEMPMEEHLKIWEPFHSALFDYRQATWGKNRRENFCYGGVWSFNLGLGNGKLKQCYRNSDTVQWIFENIDEPIHYLPRGYHCSFAHCFNSHVFDCLCGVIPEIASPYYAELRNRVLPDGTEWIQGAYKEIYNRRVCENNTEYSEEEKMFADGIVRIWNEEETKQEFVKIFQNCIDILQENNNIEIYGEDSISNWIKKNIIIKDNKQRKLIIITDYAEIGPLKEQLAKEGNTNVISVVDLIRSKNEE